MTVPGRGGQEQGPAAEAGTAVAEFLRVMRRLRAECPWKQEQTHRSLARYLLEETYETLEAIDDGERTGDWDHLREELGDLLLQVVFHAVIAEQAGEFDLDDVASDVTAKMVRRNPHVFAPAGPEVEEVAQRGRPEVEEVAQRGRPEVEEVAQRGRPEVEEVAQRPSRDLTATAVDDLWQQIKAAEKQRSSVDEGLPAALPALLYADKLLDRLERAGHPATPDPGSDDLGERLLGLVAEARVTGTDPEQALRDAVRRRL